MNTTPLYWRGIIVKESLSSPHILNNLYVVKTEIVDTNTTDLLWHIVTLLAETSDIELLQKTLNEGPWYMHFWKGEEMMVVFKEKMFICSVFDQMARRDVVQYGLSQKVPYEQLDFLMS